MSEPDSNAEAEVPVTRWSRRAIDGPTVGTPEGSEEVSDQFASLAERAARLAPPKTVSVRRIDDVFVAPEPKTLETSDLSHLVPPADDEKAVDSTEALDEETSETPNEVRSSVPTASALPHVDEIVPENGPAQTSEVEGAVSENGARASNDWPSFSTAPLPSAPVLPTTSIDPSALAEASAIGESEVDVDSLQPDLADGASAVPEESVAPAATAATVPSDPEPELPVPTENLKLAVVPIQQAVLPPVAEPNRDRLGMALLTMATALAVLSGVLGALWLRERSATSELRADLAEVRATDDVSEQALVSLNDEVRTLRLQNEQLEQQISDMSALILELPEGRVTEVDVPFTPTFADEHNGRLIAIGETGEYIVWGEGADGPITDSGSVSATPTGLFAASRKAWVATDAGFIEVLSLVADATEDPPIEFGPSMFMAPETRGYWTYNSASSEVVRIKKTDGQITDSVSIPTPVVDLTIGAGSVWALGGDGRVYRINTADLTVQAIDAGEDLIAVTAGPDALWTLSAADGSLRRVDPVTGDVIVTVPVGRDPIDATFAGSSVWVALRSGASLIEVDTRTSAVVSRTTMPSEPTALHEGDSGVFVTTAGDVPLLRVASLTPIETEPVEDAEADGS